MVSSNVLSKDGPEPSPSILWMRQSATFCRNFPETLFEGGSPLGLSLNESKSPRSQSYPRPVDTSLLEMTQK